MKINIRACNSNEELGQRNKRRFTKETDSRERTDLERESIMAKRILKIH